MMQLQNVNVTKTLLVPWTGQSEPLQTRATDVTPTLVDVNKRDLWISDVPNTDLNIRI